MAFVNRIVVAVDASDLPRTVGPPRHTENGSGWSTILRSVGLVFRARRRASGPLGASDQRVRMEAISLIASGLGSGILMHPRRSKRIFVMSLVGIVIAVPLMLLVAVLVAIDIGFLFYFGRSGRVLSERGSGSTSFAR
jgi:hypothetical protein